VSTSLIIPTRNQHSLLDQALVSIAKAQAISPVALDVVIIDNQSDDPASQHYLEALPSKANILGFSQISVLPYNEPFNYSRMNNLGVEQAQGNTLCFLNNDVEVISADWLQHMQVKASIANTGCVGAWLLYPNNTVQHAGVILGMDTIAGHAYTGLARHEAQQHPYFQSNRECSAVTGACMVMQRPVFETLEGFDEQLPVAFNDVDLCLKARQAGFINWWLPKAQLYHHESISRGKGHKSAAQREQHRHEINYMKKKWGKQVSSDPYWVVNRSSRLRIPGHFAYGSETEAYVKNQRGPWGFSSKNSFSHKDFLITTQ